MSGATLVVLTGLGYVVPIYIGHVLPSEYLYSSKIQMLKPNYQCDNIGLTVR